jgi:hypothetical protein
MYYTPLEREDGAVRLTDSGGGEEEEGFKEEGEHLTDEERGFIEKKNTFSNIVKLNTTALI